MTNQFKFNFTAPQKNLVRNLHIYGTGNCQQCPLRASGQCLKNPPLSDAAYKTAGEETPGRGGEGKAE
jgi:hypothetical protein